MKENAEQGWVERAKQSEPAAIAELYRRYWRAARAAAYGVTGDFAVAEDAASEAFYTAIEGLGALNDTQRFAPWLRTIVIRKATKAKTRGIKPENLPAVESPSPGTRPEQQELAALTHEAVASLSATLREAMSLFYFEGYSLKDAARFLDVPEGTLKRRLHEGRRRLRDAAERILKGTRPMNPQREEILEQLKDAFNEDPNSETFYQAMRQAMSLRPFPDKLLKEVMKKHWAAKLEKASKSVEKDRMVREALGRIYAPSERARDPNHPVGAVAAAIRAALPEFQPWQPDISQIDLTRTARQMFEGKSFSMPPNFADASPASYITALQAWLVQDEDGSVCTTYELMQKKASRSELQAQMTHGKKLSDALRLFWKRQERLELRAVEELLRHLAEAIVPSTPVRFLAYDVPRYRAGLRMQLGGDSVPAAIGGVHNPWPGLSDQVSVASILICLEPWAAARSGQIIELADFSLPDFLERPNQQSPKK
ncbi:MAG: sigma-70 family RNA polymerase sigma factor [Phycisphaerales bacterium]|nr:MAG: sigma-70 family RNA polymerase sigma factor [Phycisphaerales bacterium]